MCDVMTENLPITFDKVPNMYFWNMDDPRYNAVVKSATYYEFTFTTSSLPNGKVVTTVRAPIMLFDLSLDPQDDDGTYKRYFPCFPFDNGSEMEEPTYYLGRSFLAAGYVAANWMPDGKADADGIKGMWFLGQASGPGQLEGDSDPEPIAFADNQKGIETFGDYNAWVDSWSTTWKPLSASEAFNATTSSGGNPKSTKSPSPSPMSSGSSGLSKGAQVGLGVGLGLGGALLLIAGGLFFMMRRRRRRNGTTDEGEPREKVRKSEIDGNQILEAEGSRSLPHEMDGAQKIEEMDSEPVREMPERKSEIYEADPAAAVERLKVSSDLEE